MRRRASARPALAPGGEPLLETATQPRLDRAGDARLAGRRRARAPHARAPADDPPGPLPGPFGTRDRRSAASCRSAPSRAAPGTRYVRCGWCLKRWAWCRDGLRRPAQLTLGAYVLGALDPDEAAAVRRHLQECPECAAERDALAPLPGLLSLAGGAEAAVNEPLSAAFEERLLDAYAREHSPPRRRRRIGPPAPPAAPALARRRRRDRRRGGRRVAVGIVVLGGDDAAEPHVRRRVPQRRRTRRQRPANLESGDERHDRAPVGQGPAARRPTPSTRCCATPSVDRVGRHVPHRRRRPRLRGADHGAAAGEYDAIRIVRRGHAPTAAGPARRPHRQALLNPARRGARTSLADVSNRRRSIHMRRITWLIALVLAAGVLTAAGCGGDDDDGGSGGSSGGTGTEDSSSAAGEAARPSPSPPTPAARSPGTRPS